MKKYFLNIIFKRKAINKREVSRFCEQLKMLLSAGVPLLPALTIVKELSRREEFELIIQKLKEGESLASGMQGIFPIMVLNAVEGGERAGNLEEVLQRLSQYYKNRAETEDKVKSSLIYPCFVIALCFASVIVLFVFVLPGFKSLFAELGAEIPLFSRVLLQVSEVISWIWYFPLIILVILGGVLRHPQLKRACLDNLLIKIRFFSQEYMINSFRTIGSLLEGGLPVTVAMETARKSLENSAFQEIIARVKEAVENGEKLSRALSGHRIFPKEIIQMVAVGENSGRLGEMLLNIAEFCDNEKEIFIKRITSMLEPALTLVVGLVVGVITVAMFLPMVSMLAKLQ